MLQLIFSSIFLLGEKIPSLSAFLFVGAECDHPLGISAAVGPVLPDSNDDDDTYECGAVGGVRISQNTWRKPAPVSLSTP
jgi:hypothetical protein